MRSGGKTSRARLLAAALLCLASNAFAGSTEPELAIAEVTASADAGVVTVQVIANFDHDDALRLGYPLAVVVDQGAQQARLFLDGRVTLASNGAPPSPVPGAPGVVAIASTRISAVLPPGFAEAGTAIVRLEASYQDNALRSNAVEVHW